MHWLHQTAGHVILFIMKINGLTVRTKYLCNSQRTSYSLFDIILQRCLYYLFCSIVYSFYKICETMNIVTWKLQYSNNIIQPSAVITRFNSSRYCTPHCDNSELDIRITTDTPYLSPSLASYWVSAVMILEKIGRVITAPHCTILQFGWRHYMYMFI